MWYCSNMACMHYGIARVVVATTHCNGCGGRLLHVSQQQPMAQVVTMPATSTGQFQTPMLPDSDRQHLREVLDQYGVRISECERRLNEGDITL